MGEIVKCLATFAAGFATGCLYTSYKFEKNPNELVDMVQTDAGMVAGKASEAIKGGVDKVKETFKKDEVVDTEIKSEEVVG